MHGPPPTATYRVQLTPDFGFERVAAQLTRLQALGISHVHLSPVTAAVPGSTRGDDVTDHEQVRDELGGLDGLTALLDALAARGMGALIDHVPDHVAVGRAELTPRWWALLRDGPGSDAARWFDVDWAVADGTVILPVLGDPLVECVDRFEVVDGELRLGPQRFPLAAGTAGLAPAETLERQHYRLQWWRDPARNVRRVVGIDDLVAVRVEEPAVAASVDTVPQLLTGHEAFAGVCVDHVDGLADPLAYLDGLRGRLGERWLVVDKVLAAGETLPAGWPVDGTTGYEHATVLEHALLDREGWATLAAGWVAATGDARPFPEWARVARREVLDGGLRPELARATRAAAAALDVPVDDELSAAVATLSVHLGRHRTYLPDEEGHPALEAAIAAAKAERPALEPAILRLAAALESPGEWRTRWQQLTGAAAAAGVEDRASWRYLPLASLAEVGGRPAPDERDDPIATLHHHHAHVAGAWPRALLAGTTDDGARSADVRAGGLVLASVAGRWCDLWGEWAAGPGAVVDVDPATQWLALQTMLTTPGLDVERLTAFLVTAARRAAERTSATEPDEVYESAVARLAGVVLTWKPAVAAAGSIEVPARAVALAMLVARLTAPGVADVHQGTEAFRHVLVGDRPPPDHAALDALVARVAGLDGRVAWAEAGAPAAKAVALARLLLLDVPAGYAALAAPDGLVAFARTDADGEPRLVTIVPRPGARVPGGVVELPAGEWAHELVDDLPDASGRLAVDEVLEAFPAIVLVKR